MKEKKINVQGADVYSIYNGEFQLAMQPYTGWKNVETIKPEGLHPVTDKCAVQIASDSNVTEEVYVTMLAWKNGDKKFNKEELGNIKSVNISDDKKTVEILFNDKSIKTINFD